MPLPSKFWTWRFGERDHEVEEQREAEREEEEAAVAKRAEQLVADVEDVQLRPADRGPPSGSAVSARNASSSAGAGDLDIACRRKRSSSARIVWSESEQLRTTASPWRSAELTPGRRAQLVGLHVRQRRAQRSEADPALDLGRRPVGDDLPARHQHHAIGVLVGLLEIVRREEDGLAARRERAHRLPELVA